MLGHVFTFFVLDYILSLGTQSKTGGENNHQYAFHNFEN